MIHKKRPSYKELEKKLKSALECISEESYFILDITTFVKDLNELNCPNQSVTISEVINELTPEHYCGNRPPKRAYNMKISNCELYEFVINSSYTETSTYVKFAFKNDNLYIVSLHKDR
ncbi:MAG: hypothetical protein HN600_00510 [Bacteroidetes bacterium]|jgi:hypothetical protein|nr:hypothetical protein [Bacteroidota bacterium]